MRGNTERDGWTNVPDSQRIYAESMAKMYEARNDCHKWEQLARDLAHDHLGMSQQQVDALIDQYGIDR